MTLTLSFLLTFAMPSMRSLTSLMAVFVSNGFTIGFFETGTYIFLSQVWGDEVVPFMQILIAMLGIGSLSAPIIAEPYLIKQEDASLFDAASNWDMDGLNITSVSAAVPEIRLVYPYSMIATAIAFNALFSFSLYCLYGSSADIKLESEEEKKKDVEEEGKSMLKFPGSSSAVCCTITYKNIVIALAVLITHVFYGIQVCFGSFLMTFAVNCKLHLSKKTGALLTTIYWSCYTLFKLPIMLSMRSNGKILIMSFTGVLVASFLLMMSENDERILWTGVVLLSASQSPVWACVFGYLQDFFPVTEFVSSLLVVSSMMAEFVFPALISAFIASSPLVMIYITLSCAIVMFILFISMMILCNLKMVSK